MIIIRAKLNEQKSVYRDIAVDENKSLARLAEAVIDAFGFSFDHCYGFFLSPDVYGKAKNTVHYELFYDIGEDIGELTESVERTKVSEVFKKQKDKMWMLFDYGDDWIFELVYQQDCPRIFESKKHGAVVASKGESPKQYQDYEDDTQDNVVMIEDWLKGFCEAWQNKNVDGVMALFAENALYFETPQKSYRSKAQFAKEWNAILDQDKISIRTKRVMSDDDMHTVRWRLTYSKDGESHHWDGLYVVGLQPDGLCDYFYQVGEERDE